MCLFQKILGISLHRHQFQGNYFLLKFETFAFIYELLVDMAESVPNQCISNRTKTCLLHSLLTVINLNDPEDLASVMEAKLNLSYPYNVVQEPYVIIILREYHDVISKAAVRYSLIAVLCMLTFLAFTGNLLVLLAISRRRSLCRNPAIIFIMNLAICDTLSCLVYRPMIVVDILLPYTSYALELRHQIHICRAAMLLQTLIAGVGFHTIVAISQERLCLIVYPLKAKVWFSAGRSKKVLIVIWIISIGMAVPIPVMFAKVFIAYVEGTTIAYCGLFEFTQSGMAYFSTLFVIYFVLPSLVLAVTYIKIFHTLYRHSSTLHLSGSYGTNKHMKSRQSLAKMMLAVAVLFSVCWGPHFAFFLHIAMGGKVNENGYFIVCIMQVLPLISSVVNPVFYTINSKTFRSSLMSLCCHRPLYRSDDSSLRIFSGGTRASDASWMSPYRSRPTSRSGASSTHRSSFQRESVVRTVAAPSHVVKMNFSHFIERPIVLARQSSFEEAYVVFSNNRVPHTQPCTEYEK